MIQRRIACPRRIRRSTPHERVRSRYEVPEAAQDECQGLEQAARAALEATGRADAREAAHEQAQVQADGVHQKALADVGVSSQIDAAQTARSRRDARWVARDVRRAGAAAAARGGAESAAGWHTLRRGLRACLASVADSGPAPTRSCAVRARPERPSSRWRGRCCVSPALASCPVAPTTAPVSTSTAYSALWARRVRPSVIFRRFRSSRANSARVGVGMPDAAANPRRNASSPSAVSRRTMLRSAALPCSVVASMRTVFPVSKPASATRCSTQDRSSASEQDVIGLSGFSYSELVMTATGNDVVVTGSPAADSIHITPPKTTLSTTR